MIFKKKDKIKSINSSDFYTIHDLEKIKSKLDTIDLNNKKLIKILIIDDSGFDSEPLKSLGYKDVDVFTEFNNMALIEPYDVIFCDINDVAKKMFPIGQGAELASVIKKDYPEKYVVIFSAQSHKNSFFKYYELVDNVIDKTSDYSVFCDEINKYLAIKNNPIMYWENIEKRMLKERINKVEISKMEHYFVLSLLDGKNHFKKDKNIKEIFGETIEQITPFISLLSSLIELYLAFF